MKPRTNGLVLLVIFVLLSLLGGCAKVTARTVPFPEVQKYPPTDMYTVAIFRTAPVRPHLQLGEIYLEPQRSPSVSELEEKLQEAAAAMGADGVVILADKTNLMGGSAGGSWVGREIGEVQEGVVVAIAIRYLRQ
jgi:hypothetical protein